MQLVLSQQSSSTFHQPLHKNDPAHRLFKICYTDMRLYHFTYLFTFRFYFDQMNWSMNEWNGTAAYPVWAPCGISSWSQPVGFGCNSKRFNHNTAKNVLHYPCGLYKNIKSPWFYYFNFFSNDSVLGWEGVKDKCIIWACTALPQELETKLLNWVRP